MDRSVSGFSGRIIHLAVAYLHAPRYLAYHINRAMSDKALCVRQAAEFVSK